jgi:hypothetical protein
MEIKFDVRIEDLPLMIVSSDTYELLLANFKKIAAIQQLLAAPLEFGIPEGLDLLFGQQVDELEHLLTHKPAVLR